MVYLVQWNYPFPLIVLNLENEVQKQSENLLYVKTSFLAQSVIKIYNIGAQHFNIQINGLILFMYIIFIV